VAPVVAVVWLSRSAGFIGENFFEKRENRRRSFGGLYTHTHTPMDGMGKQVTEYEGAITFFGGEGGL